MSLYVSIICKYVSKSFKTLKTFCKRSLTKVVVIVIIPIPDPFNGFHKNDYNLAITCQSHLEFWDQKGKMFSDSSLKNLINKLVFLTQALNFKIH